MSFVKVDGKRYVNTDRIQAIFFETNGEFANLWMGDNTPQIVITAAAAQHLLLVAEANESFIEPSDVDERMPSTPTSELANYLRERPQGVTYEDIESDEPFSAWAYNAIQDTLSALIKENVVILDGYPNRMRYFHASNRGSIPKPEIEYMNAKDADTAPPPKALTDYGCEDVIEAYLFTTGLACLAVELCVKLRNIDYTPLTLEQTLQSVSALFFKDRIESDGTTGYRYDYSRNQPKPNPELLALISAALSVA